MKFLATITLTVILTLSSGCLATKLLIPGGEPLTVKEEARLGTIKDVAEGVAWYATETGKVAVPGGGVLGLIITGLGALLYRRRRNGRKLEA